MIDQDKMRALVAVLRKYKGTGFVVDDCHAAADAIDLLLAEVEAANSLFTEVRDYLQCVVDSSMSRNNSQNLAMELLDSIEKLSQKERDPR